MRRWAAVLLYMGLIFFVSHQAPDGLQLPPVEHLDKVAHFFEYALLGVLLLHAIDRWESRRWVVLATILAAAYGVTDEMHQSFVPGRDASAADMFADALGGFVGAAGYFWRCRSRGTSK